MKPLTQPPGTPYRLSDSFLHNFNMYALAASAAGVSLLALAQPSEAKIVYTKTHQVIGTNGVFPLDLNHDGVVDFVIQQYGSSHSYSNHVYVKEAFGNAVEGSKPFAAALQKGATVGLGQRFVSSSGPWGEVMAGFVCGEDSCPWSGQWVNVANRYLGLRFQIAGKTHYGWARLSIQTQGKHITATLTGYAYETIAHKGIRAGQTSGGAEEEPSTLASAVSVSLPAAPLLDPVSHTTQSLLSYLALGASGIALWRRP